MAKYTKRPFTCGEWFLAERRGVWHRCRFNKYTGTTDRYSLGTKNLETAKLALTEWWIANTLKKERDAADVLLDEVLLSYWHQRASKLPSGRRVKSSMKHFVFFEGMSVKKACHPGMIDEFVRAMLDKGMARTYVNNLLGILKAATQRAWKRGEVDSVPFIDLIKAQRKKPKGEPLEPEQIVALMAYPNKRLQMAMMIMLATGCRPNEAFSLSWEQVDFRRNLINFEIPGRPLTPKVRPTVKIPPSLRDYLLLHRKPSGLIITYGNKMITRWETAFRNARAAAGLSKDYNPYSFRHTIARWLRSKGVPKWEIDNQQGHAGQTTTDVYAPHAPDYLVNACAAIEELMQEVAALQKTEAA